MVLRQMINKVVDVVGKEKKKQIKTDTLCSLPMGISENKILFSSTQWSYLKVKRCLDCVLALGGLILLFPVFLLVYLCIKLDSPTEKALFKQERIGQDGRVFLMYKFRSMKSSTPEVSTRELKEADHYITSVGHFLRKTSLDELPQLWNVLQGSMSLIGPRPLIKTEEEVHFLRYCYGIYQVKPGITGLAQINGRDQLDNYDKVCWDRMYTKHVSFGMDAYILWKTLGKVVRRENIQDGGTHTCDTITQEKGGRQ